MPEGTTVQPFKGFDKALIGFLKGLEANNEKAWMEAHRADYETHFKERGRDFLAALAPRLGDVAEDLIVDPKIGRSIHRINRDTRFSKDKTPYRPYLHIVAWRGAKPSVGSGFHFVVSPKSLGYGVGMWGFQPQALDAYREAVAQPAKANALADAIERATEADDMVLDPPALKRVPQGFDPDAPHAGLLKHKGIVVRGSGPIPDALYGPEIVDLTIERFRELAPVHDWLVEHVG